MIWFLTFIKYSIRPPLSETYSFFTVQFVTWMLQQMLLLIYFHQFSDMCILHLCLKPSIFIPPSYLFSCGIFNPRLSHWMICFPCSSIPWSILYPFRTQVPVDWFLTYVRICRLTTLSYTLTLHPHNNFQVLFR